MTESGRRVLVTGGAGFLGSHLCESLLAQGHEVLCLDNFFTGSKQNVAHLLADPRFELIRQDVTLPLRVEVDEIYNLACPASPIHYQDDPMQTTRTSVIGALNVLDLARQCNARVLQASTSEVYGDPQVHPQPEHYWGNVNPIGVRACYDEGKRCGKACSWIAGGNSARTSRSRASSIPTARACIRRTAGSYRISSCRRWPANR